VQEKERFEGGGRRKAPRRGKRPFSLWNPAVPLRRARGEKKDWRAGQKLKQTVPPYVWGELREASKADHNASNEGERRARFALEKKKRDILPNMRCRKKGKLRERVGK